MQKMHVERSFPTDKDLQSLRRPFVLSRGDRWGRERQAPGVCWLNEAGVTIASGPPQAQSTAHQTFRRLLGRSLAREGVLIFSLFLLLAALLPSPAYAQEKLWKELNTKLRTLYQQGRYAEAAKVAKEALKVAEATFGPDHPDVGVSLNNLALMYKAQGKYAEAEPLYKRALVIKEKALGPTHPQVATSLNNLAVLYEAQGKYAEAEPLYRRALSIAEKELGPTHPQVAASLNNLAVLYYLQGKYAEAEPLYKRELVLYQKTLGPEHPDMPKVLENMAELYKKTGREDEARKFEERAKAIRSRNQ